MTIIDRRYSVAEGTAVKAPCRVATTANITLSGLQTIDGVAVAEGDRVLVKNQTDATTNGIYSVSTGNWTRTRDFDGPYDIVTGTRIYITSGTASAATEYVVTSSNPVVGTDAITFTSIMAGAVATATAAATAASASQSAAATSASAASSSASSASASATAAADSANIAYQRGRISGLILSTAGSSATFGISAGMAIDDAVTTLMNLASAYTKTTSAWAVGTGNGALDTGAIANSTWYHVYLIKRTDTGVVDVLISTSANSPTMPANYSVSRRIGSMKTNGSAQWTAFTQTGDKFIWAASVTDVSGGTASTGSRTSHTLTAPTGVVVGALVRAIINTGGGGACTMLFTSLQENDQATSTTGIADVYAPGTGQGAGSFERLTNTSAQIAARGSTATAYSVFTYGWIDTRGK